MKVIYHCMKYPDREEQCSEFPWADPEQVPEQCQWMVDGKLVPEGELEKSPKEIEDFCLLCGRCCFNWEDNHRIHQCSGLRIIFRCAATFQGQGLEPLFYFDSVYYPVEGEEFNIPSDPKDPKSEKIRVKVVEVKPDLVVFEKVDE